MNTLIKIALFLLFPLSVWAQTVKTERTVHTIIQERSIYLNGGMRTYVGGKSRETIKVDLPPNTKFWYYSFTTSPGESGTENLNLAVQLSALTSGGGLMGSIASDITIPEGSQSVDVYLLDEDGEISFLAKVDNDGVYIDRVKEGTTLNTKQGVIEIDDVTEGTYYLGLKNPSSLNGINIQIEVVAIVEEYIEDEKTIEGVSLGNLGWKAFERGEYDRCLELSQKALTLDNTLGFVHFNVALCYLIKGLNMDALTAYSKAIAVNRKLMGSGYNLQGAIDDLYLYMDKCPSKIDALDILELLEQEKEAAR